MKDGKIVDHLFRHQYGKMVSILTRIFGLAHLETIEDAVQDTFVSAMMKWRTQVPENPEAWLTQAAKNRAIDLLRKLKADQSRLSKLPLQASITALDEFFLDHEIADSQLKMIFTACHPLLKPRDRIAFALKTVAGLGANEIASSLLLKKETVKKRLVRARKAIQSNNIEFSIPTGQDLLARLESVHHVLYLIFNEGFHSGQKDMLIRKDLCGEAIRLVQLVLQKPSLRSGSGYALFALMCFHASRLESKVSEAGEVIDLKRQDRSLWYLPMIQLGSTALQKAHSFPHISEYHFEAAIAELHLIAPSFEETDWDTILNLYLSYDKHFPSPITTLNIGVVLLELGREEDAAGYLARVRPNDLEQRAYLYYGAMAEYFKAVGETDKALDFLNQAIEGVSNEAEKDHLVGKRDQLLD